MPLDSPICGFCMLAYESTLEPPLGMKAHPAILPFIAPLRLCRVHPIGSDCRDCVEKRRIIEGWHKMSRRIAWRPYINGGPFTTPGPLSLAEELRFVRDHGSIGGHREHQFPPGVNWVMLNWMEVKLMWDVDRDPRKLRRQFIDGHYGPVAAAAVERVYDRIETAFRTSNIDKAWPEGHNAMIADPKFYGPIFAGCRGDIQAAIQAAAKEREPYRGRVLRDMKMFQGPTEAPRTSRAAQPVTVYLLAGQSNMVGSGTPKKDLPSALRGPQADVEFYHADGPGPLRQKVWVPLQPGSTFDFGPEVTFGRAIADHFPNERVALIKYAGGNTNLAVDWNPETGPFYCGGGGHQGFRPTVKAALRALTDRGDSYRIAGMIWMQGESDTVFENMAAEYQNNLTRFIARVRADFAVPDMPFVIGRVYPGSGTSSPGMRLANVVRAAQVAVAKEDLRAGWIDLDGLPQQDAGVEFNGPGTVEMGKRFAGEMQVLRKQPHR